MNILNAEVVHSVINGLNATGVHQRYASFFVSPSAGALLSFVLAATLLTLQLMPLGAKRKRK
ncbi:hypothetical protein ACSJLR_004203 [Serratia bockelmannii]|uniref:hypothetical protein n=1 Tax=Serratia TaxID=613 RepID=UPI00020E973F|nr:MULTISPECIES: hypothetical protein [Serratia]MBH3195583.1 hypothetical protein [Serratia marcescens]AEF43447.1 hypothetical protein SerAS9_0285 [Serratia plymuthica AS9]AEF48399.1 hypothetical protein SerAS12_0285 [Serratia sp. AS12]AEG26107.1 hypothetical protein SerAS13_0284 [Serratia sp. AS13]UTN97012.1 hypothetical protein NLX81_01520 [Serratia plymuthica]